AVMRNYKHLKRSARTLVAGQRPPGERDQPLRRNETGKPRRHAQSEPRHVGQILARSHGCDTVGMPGDDVPTELIADLERTFEIDARAPLPTAHRGRPQRLGGGVDREPGAVALLAARYHGQAYAAAGDRGADVDGLRIIATGDLETGEPLRARLDRNHFADVGHDAGKHLTPARISRPCRPRWFRCRRR